MRRGGGGGGLLEKRELVLVLLLLIVPPLPLLLLLLARIRRTLMRSEKNKNKKSVTRQERDKRMNDIKTNTFSFFLPLLLFSRLLSLSPFLFFSKPPLPLKPEAASP